ncbi:hypothetical protein [Paenisporosarcina indica]|uniref:hypothetical protein n=1 Tax=Paenisporosarcina indica TaxID=650093 RepID=UPI0013729441|nr:hypothetical protein [Paenisporosarcina indica]
MAKFLKDGDKKLDETNDFEIQAIGAGSEIEDIDWQEETTFNKVFDVLEKKHGSFDVSVLDYGDELQATVTLHRKSASHHYRVLIA